MDIKKFLDQSSSRHTHLCPRQVLGVRIGLLAVKTFGTLPGQNPDKRLLAIVECDGCFSDGIEVSTGCTLGHRRLRLEDYGKIAATFVDTKTGRAIRISPKPDVRQRAVDCQPEETRRYHAQLKAYQVMPDKDLLTVDEIQLNVSPEQIISRPRVRVTCDLCGEEIVNERERTRGEQTLCRSCAGESYYRTITSTVVVEKR
jgi:formylmethanofuran dehydrogenase subunit E